MYNQGHGMYNETARSFYNVNPVFNPESNGRAAVQFPTQHVPIYNPALSVENMYAQSSMARERIATGGIVNYATQGLNAENYSMAESQASAKSWSNVMSGAGRVTSIGSGIASLALGLSNPIGWGVMAGAYVGEKVFDRYKDYYGEYSNRMGRMSDLRSTYSGVGGNIVNPYTGVMSNAAAGRMASGFSGAAESGGFSEQDMYSVHNMANKSGMMQGHTGSVDQVISRVSTLAKVTQQIMDMGAGIDQHQAMEMQRLSESMGVDLDKFKSLEVSRKIVSAAKLTGKTISATNELLASSASMSAQAGVGGQLGMESALYASRTAAPQFGFLSAKQKAAVGGSQDAYAQNIIGSQVAFAQRQASTLALGSYYVDPTTGALKIDTSELGAMVEGGYNEKAEYKRGMKILDKKNRKALKNAGINQNFVTGVLQENIGRLGQEAINSIDKDTQMGMQLREIVQTAADGGMTFNQAGAMLQYTPEQVSSIKTFGENYGKGATRSHEQERLAYRNELARKGDSSLFISNSQRQSQIENAATKGAARRDANTAGRRADKAREESVGIYGGRARQFSDEEITSVVLGTNYTPGATGPVQGLTDAMGNVISQGTGAGWEHGAYLGEREQDKSYGFWANLTGRSSSGMWRNDVSDRAISKDLLQKSYARDYTGKGTDVGGENMLGINTGIMHGIIFGETLGIDDLTGDEVTEGHTTAALREILGSGDGNLDELLSKLNNKDAAKSIRRILDDTPRQGGGVQGNRDRAEAGKKLSRALAAAAAGEIQAFSDIGRGIRTVEGRESKISKVKDPAKLRRAAYAFIKQVNDNASTNSWFGGDGQDSSDDMWQTSPAKIAGALVKKGIYKTEAEARAAVPAVLAKAATINKNADAWISKTAGLAETAGGMLGEGVDFSEHAGRVISSAKLRYDEPREIHIAGKGLRTVTEVLTKDYSVTVSSIALGQKIGDAGAIEEKAVNLASVSNALNKNGEENPTRFIGELSQAFVRWWAEQPNTHDNVEAGFTDFLDHTKYGKRFKDGYDKLSTDKKAVLKAFIMQNATTKGMEWFAKDKKGDYIKAISGFVEEGHNILGRKSLGKWLGESSATSTFFGKNKKEAVKKASALFKKLSDTDVTSMQGAIKGKGENTEVDLDFIMRELEFDKKALGDDYGTVRAMVSEHFSGGDFSKDTRQAFARDIKRQIDAGKIRPPGATGKGGAGAMIADAVKDMFILQSAMAKILAALASPDKDTKLQGVVDLLQKIKTKPQ